MDEKRYKIDLRGRHVEAIRRTLQMAGSREAVEALAAFEAEVDEQDYYMNRVCRCGAQAWEHGSTGEDCKKTGCRQFVWVRRPQSGHRPYPAPPFNPLIK